MRSLVKSKSRRIAKTCDQTLASKLYSIYWDKAFLKWFLKFQLTFKDKFEIQIDELLSRH